MKTENIETGWEMRTIIDEPRLSELAESYADLGFEVKIEAFDPKKFCGSCNECYKENPEKYKMLYTRKKQ